MHKTNRSLFLTVLATNRTLNWCGLNEKGPHKLRGRGTIRRCGLVGVGVALLQEVSLEAVIEVSEAQVRPNGSQALPAAFGSDVELCYPSSTISVCVLHASHRDDNGLNL